MQQPGGGGGGGGASQSQSQSHYVSAEEMTTPAAPSMAGEAAAAADPAQLVESASPISSRPPASAAINLDELMTLSGAAAAEDAADRGGGGGDGGGIGGSGGNRWPRQETLALLKIRSEMDTAFRDATLKGPLWEDVSRKLAELGYKRSAKKCKEKFENVHKYYKRTKEGRAGRQDGKSYKFFTELEALHGTTANVSASPPVHHATHTAANPVSVGFGSISNPMPISSFRMSPGIPSSQPATMGMFATDFGTATVTTTAATAPATATTAAPMGMSFSSNSTSSSPGSDDDDDLEGEPSNTGVSRKRKRVSSRGGSSSTRKMMEFFESLMKQVMQKQEAMQQRFLEVIEKREQDRTIREEAWKRQEIARLTREHELMTQERAISASRDAAIIAFLQKITGQTIQLPPPVNVHAAPPPPVPPSVATATPLQPPPPPHHQQQIHQQVQQQQQHQVLPHHQQSQSAQGLTRHHQQPSNISTEVVMAVPEQQLPPQEINASGGGSFEPTSSSSSSRWPKAEVLALIKLRSGLESRYQEAGPKGPLWEEISGGMQRMGYKRSSKRCKEKWENINKYFKKVKESNKQRPEDAKTCPYFHELDALYRKRILGGGGGGGSSSSLGNQNRSQLGQPQVQPPQQENPKLDSATNPQDRSTTTSQVQPSHVAAPQTQPTVATESENKNGDHSTNAEASNPALPASLFGERAEEAAKKPEDIVKELMGQQEHDHHQNQQQGPQQLVVDDYDRIEEADSDINLDQDEDMEDEDEEDDEEMENERKMGYKIEFQKQNTTGPSNGGGNGAPSFLAMVQ